MDNIRLKIHSVICNLFSVTEDQLTDSAGPGQLAKWDSIGQLRLIMDLEKAFGIQFSVDEVMSINNIGDIVQVISKSSGNPESEESESTTEQTKVVYHPVRVPPQIFWGKGCTSALKSVLSGRVAIVTGSSDYAVKIQERLAVELTSCELMFIKRLSGEPEEIGCLEISRQLKDFAPDIIVAIGGGSTIDAAKLARLIYENPEIDLNEISGLLESVEIRKKTTFVAVPTTYGSGSEASSAVAITKTGHTGKTILVSHEILPEIVFLDPSYGVDASDNILFSSAIDALTHAVEGYVSLVRNPVLESLAGPTIRDILGALKNIVSGEDRYHSIEKLCYSAYYAGLIQNHCSVGLTHSFAHQMGTLGLSHGIANATFLVPVMKYNADRVDSYEKLSHLCGLSSAEELIGSISEIVKATDIIPDGNTLNQILGKKEQIIAGAMGDITFRTNPALLSRQEVEIVFTNTIHGLLNT